MTKLSRNKKNRFHRSLNVIYFTDANKTRSFKISLTKLNVLFIILGCAAIWSLSSVFLVGNFFTEKLLLTNRLYSSLDTIFEYQSRYDGVYEIAYPRPKKAEPKNTIAKGDLASTEDSPQTRSLTKSEHKNIEPKASFKKDKSITLSVETPEKGTNKEWPVMVQDVSYQLNNNELELNFAIRNSQSPERAEGYIWSVLTLQDESSKKTYIGSPKGIKVNNTGNVKSPEKGSNWYSIRYYKEKNFYFSIPNKSTQFVQLKIGMMSLNGKKNIFNIPISLSDLNQAESHRKDAAAVKR